MKTLKWLSGHFKSTALLTLLTMTGTMTVHAQADMTVYSDSLVNGWQDWGYAAENYANTSPVHSGDDSISVTIASQYQGIQIYHPAMTNADYANISFWLNGGASGGQHLQVYGLLETNGVQNQAQSGRYFLSAPVTNTWQQYTVPLSALGVANTTNFTGFVIQDSAGIVEPTFYLDDIELAPAVAHLTVNANQIIRTADARWFGINTPTWDANLDTPQTVGLLTNMGVQALRFPGGSESDGYRWLYNRNDGNTWTWASSLANFIHVFTNINAQAMITLNYGTASTNEAAAWVAYANASTTNAQPLGTDATGFNWQTAGYWAALRAASPLKSDDGKNFLRIGRSAPLNFKYWEIGNEEYGSWETDSNSVPHDPYTYAVRAQGYISLIKAVDPAVKIGVVVTPGENSYANNTSHPAYNPREGSYHNGWTAVLLATLKSEGIMPDFLIHHRYPQNPGGESDAELLDPTDGWASDAADLRQQITDYIGAGGTNIELLCTENNSVSSLPGKQSTSLVNGLYKADSMAQLMQTEFNGLFWWDLRNGSETDGNFDSSLYGWRTEGDYGIVDINYSPFDFATNCYPTYYTSKLMRHFASAGDAVISAGSDYSSLSTYAVRRLDGSLTILVINKEPAKIITGQVAVAGYALAPNGTAYSYGMTQDNAVKTGVGSPDIAQTNFSISGTNFNYVFPPYSATVLAFSTIAPPQFKNVSMQSNGAFKFTFTNFTGLTFSVLESTNLALPMSDWTVLGTAVESPAGQYQFTDSPASDNSQRFYRIRSP